MTTPSTALHTTLLAPPPYSLAPSADFADTKFKNLVSLLRSRLTLRATLWTLSAALLAKLEDLLPSIRTISSNTKDTKEEIKHIALCVLVPLFNAEKYLKDCLKSLASQDMQDFHVFILDDKSSDKGYEVARDYIATHALKERYHLYSQTRNLGSLKARLELVRIILDFEKLESVRFSKFISIDSDDAYIQTSAFSYLLELSEKSGADMARAGATRSLRLYNKLRHENKALRLGEHRGENERLTGQKLSFTSFCNTIFTRDLLLKYYDFMSSYKFLRLYRREDIISSVVLCSFANYGVSASPITYLYRFNPKSVTTSLGHIVDERLAISNAQMFVLLSLFAEDVRINTLPNFRARIEDITLSMREVLRKELLPPSESERIKALLLAKSSLDTGGPLAFIRYQVSVLHLRKFSDIFKAPRYIIDRFRRRGG